jgi:hypothetical protein
VTQPIYLIEDTCLDDNVCLWYKIPGLSSSNQIGGMDFWPPVRQGVVMWLFYKYFIDEAILPFVQDIQAIIVIIWRSNPYYLMKMPSANGTLLR